MAADEKLGDQFRAVVADGGELERTFSTATHMRGVVPVTGIREGDLFRHVWQHEFPYQRATGPAIPDPDYPKEGHVVIPIPRSVTPHMHNETKLRVIRERRTPRAS